MSEITGNPITEIKLEMDVKDVANDSLEIIEIVMHLEEHFNIVIPDDAVETVKTVEDMVSLVRKAHA